MLSTLSQLLQVIFIALVIAIAIYTWQRGLGSFGTIGGSDARTAQTESELREALRNASSAIALAEERKSEIQRLTSSIQDLQARLSKEISNVQILSSKVAGQEAQVSSAHLQLTQKVAQEEQIKQQLVTLRERLEAETRRSEIYNAKILVLENKLQNERDSAAEKIALLSKFREEMQERFKQLSGEVLKTQGDLFGKVTVERLESTLIPLREHVGHFEKGLREMYQQTSKDREALRVEISQLTARSEAISHEALALTRALKGNKQKQGTWGEMILSNILEQSGLRKGEQYETQAHRLNDDGERLRPDVVIKMPGGKSLVIDSKVSLNDYETCVTDDDDKTVAEARRRHVNALKAHINSLSSKSYQLSEGTTVDYVVMFIPIEGALAEALREDRGLTEYALEKHIAIATPTTLMMALRTVAHVWSVEKRNQNADEIARRAGLLYDKVANFLLNFEKIGKNLEQSQTAYSAALTQMSIGRGNLLSQIETLKVLGAKTTRSLPIDFDEDSEDTGKAITEVLKDPQVIIDNTALIQPTTMHLRD